MDDYVTFTRAFFHHLAARGYAKEQLEMEFLRAASNLDCLMPQRIGNDADVNRELIFLHMQFHPFQVPWKEIQVALAKHLSNTLWTTPNLQEKFDRLGIKRLIIALSRATNL